MEKSDMCDMYNNMLSEVVKFLSNLCYSGAFIFTATQNKNFSSKK